MKNKISRYIKRCARGLLYYPNSVKEFGFSIAHIQLRRIFSCISVEKYVNSISNYMIVELQNIIKKYNNGSYSLFGVKRNIGEKIPVWVCWLQGEKNMPEICRACVNRMRKILPNKFELILLTYDNYLSYIDIPNEIVEKHKKGVISAPNYSDIIRFALLSMYGGVWLDATIYLTKDIVSMMVEQKFYTVNFYEKDAPLLDASRGKWTGFLCASERNSIVARFTYDALLQYWEEHNLAVDYLAVDYIIWAGYENVFQIKKLIDTVPYNNKEFDLLNQIFEEPALKDTINLLMSSNGFYKINRHRKYLKETKTGQQTVYGYILQENNVC